jgi:hypothetical protein
MIKKEIFFPLLAAILGFVFILLSLMVWLNRGKNNGLLKRKLRIGALILALTTAASCGSPHVSCYEMPRITDTGQIKDHDSLKKDTVHPKVKKDTLKKGRKKTKDTGWQDIRKTCYMPVRRDSGNF